MVMRCGLLNLQYVNKLENIIKTFESSFKEYRTVCVGKQKKKNVMGWIRASSFLVLVSVGKSSGLLALRNPPFEGFARRHY